MSGLKLLQLLLDGGELVGKKEGFLFLLFKGLLSGKEVGLGLGESGLEGSVLGLELREFAGELGLFFCGYG